jgi:hypothetical protein
MSDSFPPPRPPTAGIAANGAAISDSRPGSKTIDGTGLPFTYGVPSARQTLDLRKPKFPKQDRHFRTFSPRVEHHSLKSRG